jgi:glutaminyl-tRNA synthetase
MENTEEEKSINFIEEIVKNHLEEGKYSKIVTRFPPEPNGYLHIGHASSICLNFGLTQTFPGYTNLRFDDTNPVTEETEFVNSIKEDIAWLGFKWEKELYASDYFDQLYDYALQLILQGDAYVDDLSSEEMAQQKGNIGIPGIHSPYRSRSIEENLDLFKRMRAGEFADGSKTLRAKIAMDSPNLIMRDPVLYRIKKAPHHRTGDKWCIYPMYDFAHGQSDSIEEITHSICTMEFVPHRELYDWLIDKLGIYPSKQYEFARRNVTYTITSKRKLLQLVKDKHVNGWDDPRMPTISGMRRRGYPPSSVRDFCERIGIGKRDNRVDIGLLEFCVREELNKTAPRVMAVMNPLKVKITNLPEDYEEWLEAENSPEDASLGSRKVPFSNTLLIEAEDFMINPPKKYFRLFPQGAVRLKNAYIVQCDEVVYKADGSTIDYLACSIVPNSKSGEDSSGMKVKGTIHWVSLPHAKRVEVRAYDRLFTSENPLENKEIDFLEYLNPESFVLYPEVYIEPNFGLPSPYQPYQFLRLGYFSVDPDSKEGAIVFNKVVGLKDSWAKINKKE